MTTNVEQLVGWKTALKVARKTVNLPDNGKEPSSKWKYQMLFAEHSPIRCVKYLIDMEGIKRWVSGH